MVGETDVAAVSPRAPASRSGELVAGELERLQDLEADLHARVIGQEQAVELVADTVRRARVGLSDGDKPLGTFLFLGPTGVGKTELVKALSERLFATEKALVRIDMSEFRAPHTVARLIGSPPGYVGYGDGGQLTEPVRRRPYSVILLDEIEKAHPEVWNVLLQLMDDGRLTDGEGRTVDFTNTVVVMTSNLGAGEARRGLGFTAGAAGRRRGPDARRRQGGVPARVPQPDRRDRHVRGAHARAGRADRAASWSPAPRRGCARSAGSRSRSTPRWSPGSPATASTSEFGARPLQRHVRRTLEKALTRGDPRRPRQPTARRSARPRARTARSSSSRPASRAPVAA